jgi:glutamyl-tRNA reductase
MNLRMIGCTYHDADLNIRQRLAFDQAQIELALKAWQDTLPDTELAILSTCNRVELYAASRVAPPEPDTLVTALAKFHGLAPHDVADKLTTLADQEVASHLFRVAASLDSMVVGEPQILAQVKQAFQAAQDSGTVGPQLHELFQAALRAGKRVTAETSLHRHRVSIPSVAISELATCVFETFTGKHVLVTGAGEMADETLRYLQGVGQPQIHVVNRSRERGEQLAAKWHGTFHPWEELWDQLTRADLAISTTAAAEPIVTATDFTERVTPKRHQRPLVILDLAVPRDFDPAVGSELGVYLYSIDDLDLACRRNRAARAAELPAAELIVLEETGRFTAEAHLRATAPVITGLREGLHRPKEAELERLFHKLPELDDRSRDEIRQFADRLVNKLLHPPLESLRTASQNGTHHGLLEALKRLFKIED